MTPGPDEEITPRQSRASRRRRKARKPWALWVAAAVLLFVLPVVVWAAWKYAHVSNNIKLEPTEAKHVTVALDAPPPAAQPVRYLLILGADIRPGQTRGRADTIMIARLDEETGKVAILSIPRDARVKIPGHGYEKINAAMVHGGPALMIETVKATTGLPINDFVAIDFLGFAKAVDVIGGVEIDVKRAINDKNGSHTGGVSNVTRIPAGRQRLSGRQALTFVRSRKYADGDFSRMRNQQVFITALARQALSKENIDKLPGVVDVVSEHMKTDMDVVELTRLARTFKGLDQGDVQGVTIPGKPKRISGVSYVVLDTVAQKRVVEAFKLGTVEPVVKQTQTEP